VWSRETYDRELVNIFAIQDEITEMSVSYGLEAPARLQIASETTNNTEAYQGTYRARYFWNLQEKENLYLATDILRQLTTNASADAWLGLANHGFCYRCGVQPCQTSEQNGARQAGCQQT
jgi:predicted DNA-binding protein